MSDVKERFLNDIENIVINLGYECVHVGIKTDFGRMKIQVLIDSIGGINVDDCESVSKRVNKFLDESDNNSEIPELDKGRYYLEVSSPGIERPLYKFEDYIRFQGREARVKLSKLYEGRKTFTGIINSALEGKVCLLCDDGEKCLLFDDIKGGNLVYRFENENDNEFEKNKRKGRKHK